MISIIDHIGIAVSNLEETLNFYTEILGLKVEKMENHNEQKVKVAFLPVGETELELLESTDPEGPITKFIKSKGEGIQHIAFRTGDIENTISYLKKRGIRLIDERPRIGAGGSKIIFLHPKYTYGVLVEFVERKEGL
jgi:methylmalonyl-CoA/ethylmalonyl-CoA epimerase